MEELLLSLVVDVAKGRDAALGRGDDANDGADDDSHKDTNDLCCDRHDRRLNLDRAKGMKREAAMDTAW